MSDFRYIKEAYGITAQVGMRVIVNGKHGTIAEDRGHHIGVNFDEDKPGIVKPCHPTWRVEYTDEIAPLRKATRGQRRYLEYLKVADCFDDFRQFLRWKQHQKNHV